MLIGDAINLAMEHEQAGRLAEAEKICRVIVEQYPTTSAAWNLLAMIAARSGQDEIAVEHLTRAITGDPNIAALHANLGELKKRMGRGDEALAAFQRAAELEPESAIMRNKLGIALRLVGNFEASAAEFARAMALDPAYADPHNNRGNALRDLGRLDEAIEEYRVAIRLKPNLAEAHVNLGNVLGDRSRFDEALAEYQAALRIQPNHAETLNSLANLLRRMTKFDEALTACREAIRLKPGYAEGYNILGSIFYDREQFDEAIAAFEKAIELEPNNAMKRNNLAMAFGAAGKLEEAIGVAQTAVEVKPDYAEGFNTLGNLLADRGRYDAAAAAFGRAIQLRPDYALAHWNLSLILLLRGDFENGWAEQEWRRKTTVESRSREFAQPTWDGGDLRGRTILLHQEQGFGDMIQFVRYAPLVAERGGRVILSCAPPLASLLREIPEVAGVYGQNDLPEFDCHCPMLSLPAVFKTRLDSIPAKTPYLKAPAEALARWREILAAKDGKLRVGLAWAGNPKRRLDRGRSVALEQLTLLSKINGIRLYSLQKGHAPQTSAAVAAGMELIDLSDRLNDFAETAAAIENLDLVISVDTAVAHLAGALGKPVWVLIGFVPASRWMLDRNDSPWYPTMRLFRQPAMDDWNTPIARIAETLREKTNR
jgi:tetratricopeptide (TPR) repeat protein